MSDQDEDMATRLERIERKLDAQAGGVPPSAFSAAQRLRDAYRRSHDAEAAVREDGGDLTDRSRAMREAHR